MLWPGIAVLKGFSVGRAQKRIWLFCNISQQGWAEYIFFTCKISICPAMFICLLPYLASFSFFVRRKEFSSRTSAHMVPKSSFIGIPKRSHAGSKRSAFSRCFIEPNVIERTAHFRTQVTLLHILIGQCINIRPIFWVKHVHTERYLDRDDLNRCRTQGSVGYQQLEESVGRTSDHPDRLHFPYLI